MRADLEEVGCADLLVSEASSYRLDLEPENIDIRAFTTAARQLLGDKSMTNVNFLERADEVRNAWVADPFLGITENRLLTAGRLQLLESRALLDERCALAHLSLGQPDRAVDSLRNLLSIEPWRERCWALLMIALYRSGRQRDAIETFRHARSRMINELGIEPGQQLKTIELMILNQDDNLTGDKLLKQHFAPTPPA